MCLLKNGVPFVWDDFHKVLSTCLRRLSCPPPCLVPQTIDKHFLLYLTTSKSIVSMVLVQEDDAFQENFIYYLSCGLVGP
jgi:hypothetical protein